MYDKDVEEYSLARKYYNDGCLEQKSKRYECAVSMFDKCLEVLHQDNCLDSELAEQCLARRAECEQSIILDDLINEEEKTIHIGVKEYPFGRYEGEMVVGVEMGEGRFYFKDGRVIEGIFRQNHCKGKCTYPELGVYEGEFVNFKKHGRGVFTLKDGRKCIATWKNDFFHGVVTYIDEKTGKKEVKYYANGVEVDNKNISNKR